ncbi:trichohyalin-like [Oryza brachyantha]|uniref:Uncharacterized protein n=1 Tax=Oryza brachyantha TaxID=4533 RepID=J3LVH5_ORYBR|nr:trichohyalin-like [Oryza brachyantha]
MGDMKHTKLKIRCASRKEIQDAIHHDVPGLQNHKYSSDGSSLIVEIGGHVDVGKLYERLKKIAYSVKIESVVPGDLKAEMEDLESRLRRKREENKSLKEQAMAAEEETQRLKRDKEYLNSKLDKKRAEIKSFDENLKSVKREKEYLSSKLERKREDNTRLEEENKKLQRKIKELEQIHKEWTSGTLTRLDRFEYLDLNHHGVHHRVRKEVHRREFHLHQEVRQQGNLRLEGGHRRN